MCMFFFFILYLNAFGIQKINDGGHIRYSIVFVFNRIRFVCICVYFEQRVYIFVCVIFSRMVYMPIDKKL